MPRRLAEVSAGGSLGLVRDYRNLKKVLGMNELGVGEDLRIVLRERLGTRRPGAIVFGKRNCEPAHRLPCRAAVCRAGKPL